MIGCLVRFSNLRMEEGKFSSEEARTYDRQIRLWGRDTQSRYIFSDFSLLNCRFRLRETRVLIVQMTGMGVELTKNLTLSGVGHITVLDPATLASRDLGANFLVTDQQVCWNEAKRQFSIQRPFTLRLDKTAQVQAWLL